jgi:hypothetical protein
MKLTAIIGVISITIIVVIVAAITFAHVESIREQQLKKNNQFIEGWVNNIIKKESINLDSKTVDVYLITLLNNSSENTSVSYSMIFLDTYPPYLNLHLRFYYEQFNQEENTYFLINEIEQIP